MRQKAGNTRTKISLRAKVELAIQTEQGQSHPFAACRGAKSDRPVCATRCEDQTSQSVRNHGKNPITPTASHCLSFIRLPSQVRPFPGFRQLSQWFLVKVNAQSAMERRTAHIVRSGVLALALVGLMGCQELSPSAGPGSSEAPAVTTLALPSDSSNSWALLTTEARTAYAGTELGDGSVLVCGGSNGTVALYVTNCSQLNVDFGTSQPISRSFPLPDGRIGGTLTLLPSNRVLLAGGKDSSNKVRGALLSAPIGSWSNGQGFWEATEDLPNPRTAHTATLLDSSIVLIGGEAGVQQVSSINVRSDQGVWSALTVAGGLATRSGHTATVLKSQQGKPARVLVLGGYSTSQQSYLNSGFIFSLPNSVTPISQMPDARQGHTATLLADGSVLVVGGEGGSSDLAFLGTAWRYYPDTDNWVSAGSTTARKFHAAVRFGAGAMIAGGQSDEGLPSDLGPIVLRGLDDGTPSPNTVQRFDSQSNAWSSAPNLHRGRRDFQLFALDEAHLLAVGGNAGALLDTSEVFSAGALGQIRSDPNSCVSGHVADGVCCNTECSDPCHWCNDPTEPGVCKSVTGATPNQNGCQNHLQCSAGNCPQQCQSSSQCEAGLYCRGGACVETKSLGSQCNADGECPDGNPCVHGVCCESSCSGACEACDRSGKCQPLANGELPRVGHPSCAHADDQACAASCDGTTRDRCTFPGSDSSCGAVCTNEGLFQPAGECNGSGICVTAAPAVNCAPYTCDENGCLNACTASSGCSKGNNCHNGVCTPACDEDACNANGYRCDPDTDQCRNTCQTSETDCAGSFYCHPLDHQCVKAVAFPAGSLPACGIGRQPVRSHASVLVLAAILCAGAARRTRRTNRRRAR